MSFQEKGVSGLLEAQRHQLESQSQAIKNLVAKREQVRQRRRSVLRQMEQVERQEADLEQRKEELLAEKERQRKKQLKREIRFHGEQQRRKKMELAMRKQWTSSPPPQGRENPDQFQGRHGAATTSDFTGLSGIEPLRTRVSLGRTSGKSPHLIFLLS